MPMNYEYIKDRNYQEEINMAVEAGDYEMAAELERQRNAKIDGDGESFSYAKTYNYNDAPEAAASGGGSSSGNAPSSNYGGNIDKLLRRYLDRDPFSYDYTTDPLYQQYADQYTRLGDLAMKDTLGQVSARTGGLASSYAAAASQGAYDSYMQALAAKIPELYSLAYSMYQDEGE
ncbi:MAG TPA: hypothetical protein VN446_06745 [Candidatus Acidoferrum sp.]|nr:hypothetical protein [Candidatus Acidoferrum sp.]